MPVTRILFISFDGIRMNGEGNTCLIWDEVRISLTEVCFQT